MKRASTTIAAPFALTLPLALACSDGHRLGGSYGAPAGEGSSSPPHQPAAKPGTSSGSGSWYPSPGEFVTPEDSFTHITSGAFHSCALHADGSAACWGEDGFGQASPPNEPFVALAASAYYTCGLRANGSVRCWGEGIY